MFQCPFCEFTYDKNTIKEANIHVKNHIEYNELKTITSSLMCKFNPMLELPLKPYESPPENYIAVQPLSDQTVPFPQQEDALQK